MNQDNRLSAEEHRLAETFPEWQCHAIDDERSTSQGEFTVQCQRAMPARPRDVDESGQGLTFIGTSWDDAFRQATAGLGPSDDPAPSS